MPSGTRTQTRTPGGQADDLASRAAALKDLSPRGARLSSLAHLARSGPAATTQRAQLASAFGGVAQLGRKDKGKKGGGGGGGGGTVTISEQDLLRYYWLFLLQRFLGVLNAAYTQNDPQPESVHVGTKDQLMHPPTSGVKGSDHHTDTSGGGKKGRHVSSNQLKSDVQEKIDNLLNLLKLSGVPDHCKSDSAWDKWRNDKDPGAGGGGGGGGISV